MAEVFANSSIERVRNVQFDCFKSRLLKAGGVAAYLTLATMSATALASGRVGQDNLVTDDQAALTALGFTAAAHVDPHLINPWGVSFAPTGPFWVSNQGDATSTLYDGSGTAIPLVVAIPQNATAPAGPTGQVFNASNSFVLPTGGKGLFFFANLDGTISGWNGAQGSTAVKVAGGDAPAIYTGLAIGNSGGNDYLYAANHLTGAIDVFDGTFAKTTLAGNFTDPGANPLGLVPFNARNIGGHLYVTYAVAGADADEASLGAGFVSEFNLDGTFVRRLATGGELLSPWGLEIAPSSFGSFGGALLVGNFSEDEGLINAFSLTDGSFLGSLRDAHGDEVEIPYLWALTVGNDGSAGDTDKIYFAAGIGDEEHGLFGRLTAVPEPAEWAMLLTGFGMVGAAMRRRKARIAVTHA